MSKRNFKVHSKLWALEALGIFQRGYYPRGYNYCTSVMSLLLGSITSKVSLTNHPKVRTNGTFWRSECSSLHMLQTMNNVVGGKIKCKQKDILSQSIRDGHVLWSVSRRNLL